MDHDRRGYNNNITSNILIIINSINKRAIAHSLLLSVTHTHMYVERLGRVSMREDDRRRGRETHSENIAAFECERKGIRAPGIFG